MVLDVRDGGGVKVNTKIKVCERGRKNLCENKSGNESESGNDSESGSTSESGMKGSWNESDIG